MTIYRYTAIRKSGGTVEGEIEAPTRSKVLDQLNELGHLPVEVFKADGNENARARGFFFFRRMPSRAQITIFTRELAMLLKAGLTLDQTLAMLEQDQRGSSSMSRMISQLRAEIGEGRSFSESLQVRGAIFPPDYYNMVRVAEASGTLQGVLEQIAEARERNQRLRNKLLSATLYPSFLIVMAIGMVTFLLTFVVPRFKDMITQAGAEIPDSARFVIGASDWLNANWQALVMALTACLLLLALLSRRPAFRNILDIALLRAPVIGYLARVNLVIRFCRTMGTLLKSGVELPTALALCRDTIGIRPAAAAMGEALEALRKGQNFIDPLARSGLFLPVAVSMLRVGEETGKLSASALYLAQLFEEKSEVAVQRVMTVLEPLIIILVSLFVAAIIVAILGAVVSVNDLVI